MDIVFALIAGVIGVLIGGVINVLADDLPERVKIRPPHYPDGTPRPRSAWLGLTAFLTGQRSARNPAPTTLEEGEALRPARLSWRHPLVEIGTGLAMILMVTTFRDETNWLVWSIYVAILILITVIDIEHRLILFAVIIPACIFALLVALITPEEGKNFGTYLIGGGAGFALFFLMFLGGVGFSQATNAGEIAFGFGDVMLATLSGLILGWRAFIFASLITVFAGALGAMLYLTARSLMRRRYRLFTPLPYGPYIVIGTLVMLLFRDEVAQLLGATP
ncbi:MAG TPA: A24 family peptidase [Aggregatilineaceae bacterium]|nr:A24 family peptidase [Aggregatilineaceae bacterium]